MDWCVSGLLFFVPMAIVNSESIMEPYIHKGIPADINIYAHAVSIAVMGNIDMFSCGSSLINQEIILTAAHCFDFVTIYSTIAAFAGHENRKMGQKRKIIGTLRHYNYKKGEMGYDIALALLESPFILGISIRRVALTKYFEEGDAKVAGWGIIDDKTKTNTIYLHQADQYLISRAQCYKILPYTPTGTFCGGNMRGDSHPTLGDSGSAVLKYGYLQFGIVSYRYPKINAGITIYTDVSFYYNWIQTHTKQLYCNNRRT